MSFFRSIPAILRDYGFLILSTGLNVYYSVYLIRISLPMNPDAVYEFHNAKNLLLNHQFEPGPIIQQLIFALAFAIFGIDYYVMLYTILFFSIILIVALFYLTSEIIDNKPIAGFSTILYFTFIDLFPIGSYLGKHYPIYLSFFVIGLYFLVRFDRTKNIRYLQASIGFFFLGYLSHIMMTPTIIIPVIYILFNLKLTKRSHDSSLKDFFFDLIELNKMQLHHLRTYTIMAFSILAPFLFWRISVSGFDKFYEYPVSWGTHKYGPLINEIFWNQPVPTKTEYWNLLLDIFSINFLSPHTSMFFIFGMVLLFLRKDRMRHIILITLAVILIPFLLQRVPPTSVYLYPFIPYIILGFSSGIENVVLNKKKTITKSYRSIFALILIFLLLLCINSTQYYFRINQTEQYNEGEEMISELKEIKSLVQPNTKILHRTYVPEAILDQNDLMIFKDADESEIVSYLTWENDQDVIEFFIKYDLRYVILYADLRWEVTYHDVWLNEYYNRSSTHVDNLKINVNFNELFHGNAIILYEFDIEGVEYD